MKTTYYKPTGLTAKQRSAFWKAFSASCSAQGLTADAREPYRKQIMLELCGVEHMAHEMIEGPSFKLAFLRGDDAWASSINLDFIWLRCHYWHCWFLPWWRR